MEKRAFAFLSAVILIFVISAVNAENRSAITGSTLRETITGDITNVLVLNITVSGPPGLVLLGPKNHTYFSSQNLVLNFTVSDEEWIKYSLDSAENVTITGNTKFNTTEGSHSIFLYANNTNGLTIKNVTFFVNSNQFAINYTEYSNSYKGNSTDFNASSFSEIQNLSGVTLEHTSFGKILFNEVINLTDDLDFDDGEVDLNSPINISSNRIYVNLIALRNLNKSATLTLYDLTFTDPRILKDGSVCPSTICTEQSYSAGGTFIFNVTGFSVYSSEETPVESGGQQQSPGGGGGSSGSSGITSILPIKKEKFSVNLEKISVSLTQGEVKTIKLKITNNENKKYEFEIEEQKLWDLIKINEEKFEIEAGKSKTISIDFIARESEIPDIYLGKFIIKGIGEEKEILVVVEVESKGALLDVKAEILRQYQKIIPGKEVLAKITLFNLGISERADINLEYTIRDRNDKEWVYEHETVAIETQTSFVKTLEIPEDVKYGDYILYVKATYDGKVASASTGFKVVEVIISDKEKLYILSILFLIVILSIIVYYVLTSTRRDEKIKKVINFKKVIRKR